VFYGAMVILIPYMYLGLNESLDCGFWSFFTPRPKLVYTGVTMCTKVRPYDKIINNNDPDPKFMKRLNITSTPEMIIFMGICSGVTLKQRLELQMSTYYGFMESISSYPSP
jgi:hypothetical protein